MIKELIDKYKDNEYMSQRIYNHIVNYLPNTLDNELKNHEKRVTRNNYLTNEQQIFIQVFLSKNKVLDWFLVCISPYCSVWFNPL